MCQLYFGIFFFLVYFTTGLHAKPRIIGGTNVLDYSTVSFLSSLRFFGHHRCGATILSERFALSATHCLTGSLDVAYITIFCGSVYMNNDDRRGSIHAVEEYFLHPKYNSSNYDYDVAVLRVKDLFILGNRLSAVRLSTQGMPLVPEEDITLVGWGWTESGRESQILRRVTLPLMDLAECHEIWGDIMTDRMICAGVEGRDSCSGDSGGPLLFRGLQVGITSSGSSNCGGDIPSLYTSISHPEIRQFIRNHTRV